MSTNPSSQYVIEAVFDTDENSSGLSKAAAWMVMNGHLVDFQTVVGDAFSVSIYYVYNGEVKPAEKQVAEPSPIFKVSGPATTSIRVDPASYSTATKASYAF